MDTSDWTPDDLLRELEPWLAKQRRFAWLPQVEQRDTTAMESSFCGQPWMETPDDWPSCNICERPLQLFLQLDLGTLPTELGTTFGTGYLQLFYCRHTSYGECHGEGGWEPFSDACSCVRIVHPSTTASAAVNHNMESEYPPVAIVGWQQIDDLPNGEEHDSLGLICSAFRVAVPELDIRCSGIRFYEPVCNRIRSHGLDKLAGWPNWVQGEGYPMCPRCGERMQFIMQIDSGKNVPYMFGDGGMGYITQCPRDLDIVAFGWDCS